MLNDNVVVNFVFFFWYFFGYCILVCEMGLEKDFILGVNRFCIWMIDKSDNVILN